MDFSHGAKLFRWYNIRVVATFVSRIVIGCSIIRGEDGDISRPGTSDQYFIVRKIPKVVQSSFCKGILLDSHQGDSSSIPGRITHDAAGRRVFSGISRFLRPRIPPLLRSRLISRSLALEISLLRADHICQLNQLRFCLQSTMSLQHCPNRHTHVRYIAEREEENRETLRSFLRTVCQLDLRGCVRRRWERLMELPVRLGGYGGPRMASSIVREFPSSESRERKQASLSSIQRRAVASLVSPFDRSSDTHKTPCYGVKRCRERKLNIKASEHVKVDVLTQIKRPCPQHQHTQFLPPSPPLNPPLRGDSQKTSCILRVP
ncbi:hypothetical protein PR048_030123 [Dryococelus australis]|uniref:Uncharacterized protein n=1 Tax=Dryococelus australis TaxID=614101 RepID=A0ABQ9G815_9NEOP|nr:hypothetical protein PR048_030123 [Dryococelus australis]